MLDYRLQTSAAQLILALAGGGAGGSLLYLLTLLLFWLPFFPSLSVSGGAGGAGSQSGHRPSRFSSAHCVRHTSMVSAKPQGKKNQLRRKRGLHWFTALTELSPSRCAACNRAEVANTLEAEKGESCNSSRFPHIPYLCSMSPSSWAALTHV